MLSATITYAGGTTVPVTTSSSGSLLVKVINGVFAPDLPASIGTGETHNVTVTYTNTGSGIAYGINDPSTASSFTMNGGMCTSGPTVTCNGGPCGAFPVTLVSGGTIAVSCPFMATVPGPVIVSSTLTYAGGTTTATSTTPSTASIKVLAQVIRGYPTNSEPPGTYPITLGFYNSGTASIVGPAIIPIIIVTFTRCTGKL